MPDWLIDTFSAFSSNANSISASAAVITAIIAVIALRSTSRDSRERSRPLVIALFRQSKDSDSSYQLVIRNFGTSAARDLRVQFDPPFSEKALANDLVKMIDTRYGKPTALLPPEGELANVWWSGSASGGGNELTNHLPTPEDVTVSLSYKGNRFRRYRDTFALEANAIKLTSYSTSSASMMGMTKTIRDSIKRLADEAKVTNSRLRGIESAVTPPEPVRTPRMSIARLFRRR